DGEQSAHVQSPQLSWPRANQIHLAWRRKRSARCVPIRFLGSSASLLWLFRRQLHVLSGYGNRCAMLRHIDMSRPEDAVHDGLTKSLLAEVVVKMAADEAERSSAFGVWPFVDPADRIVRAFNHRGHDRPG